MICRLASAGPSLPATRPLPHLRSASASASRSPAATSGREIADSTSLTTTASLSTSRGSSCTSQRTRGTPAPIQTQGTEHAGKQVCHMQPNITCLGNTCSNSRPNAKQIDPSSLRFGQETFVTLSDESFTFLDSPTRQCTEEESHNFKQCVEDNLAKM